jgi:hypothetical protein
MEFCNLRITSRFSTVGLTMLIDISLIPPRVANKAQIDRLNNVFDRLNARKIDRLTIPEPVSGFRHQI